VAARAPMRPEGLGDMLQCKLQQLLYVKHRMIWF